MSKLPCPGWPGRKVREEDGIVLAPEEQPFSSLCVEETLPPGSCEFPGAQTWLY